MTTRGLLTTVIVLAVFIVDVAANGVWRGLIIFVVFGGAGFFVGRFYPWRR